MGHKFWNQRYATAALDEAFYYAFLKEEKELFHNQLQK